MSYLSTQYAERQEQSNSSDEVNQNNVRTNHKSGRNSQTPVIQRVMPQLLFYLMVLSVMNACMNIPKTDAFSHTSYTQCNSAFRKKVGKHCDYSTNYCGYVVVRLPRGGFENAECISKRHAGYVCNFNEQCLSDYCAWGKCI